MIEIEPSPEEWWSEIIPRHGQFILILYFGDEARGQLDLRNKEECEQWEKTLEHHNSKLES